MMALDVVDYIFPPIRREEQLEQRALYNAAAAVSVSSDETTSTAGLTSDTPDADDTERKDSSDSEVTTAPPEPPPTPGHHSEGTAFLHWRHQLPPLVEQTPSSSSPATVGWLNDAALADYERTRSRSKERKTSSPPTAQSK